MWQDSHRPDALRLRVRQNEQAGAEQTEHFRAAGRFDAAGSCHVDRRPDCRRTPGTGRVRAPPAGRPTDAAGDRRDEGQHGPQSPPTDPGTLDREDPRSRLPRRDQQSNGGRRRGGAGRRADGNPARRPGSAGSSEEVARRDSIPGEAPAALRAHQRYTGGVGSVASRVVAGAVGGEGNRPCKVGAIRQRALGPAESTLS